MRLLTHQPLKKQEGACYRVDIYGSHFEYAGVSSGRYGLIMANVNTERYIGLGGTTSSISVFDKHANVRYFIGDDYRDSQMVLDIDIITERETPLLKEEIREINRWLFYRGEYKKLYINRAYDEDNHFVEIIDGQEKRLYLNCRFLNPIKLEYNGGVVGFRVRLEADSNMFWQDPISAEVTINNPEQSSVKEIPLVVRTDGNMPIHPKVTITMGSAHGGDVEITNLSDMDSAVTGLVGLPKSGIIIIDSGVNKVNDQYYAKMSPAIFPRLVDGVNTIRIKGNVSKIKYEFQNRRYYI